MDEEKLQWVSIPLQRLALCLDCDVGFNVENRQCPRCGGVVFLLLARIVAPRTVNHGAL